MRIEAVRAEDVKQGDVVVYAGLGRCVLGVQVGPIVGLQTTGGQVWLGRGASVDVVAELDE